MGKNYFWDILRKHLNGETTPREEALVRKWLQQDVRNQQFLAQLRANWKQGAASPQEYDVHAAKERLFSLIHTSNSSSRVISWNWLGRVAAVAVPLIGLMTLLLWKQHSPASMETVVNEGTSIKEVHLADGTALWLAPESSIHYPTAFEPEKREVTLQGEAFFEVFHDANRPFSIHTGTLTTTVLGTSFDIEAYPEEPQIAVTVATGKVAVKEAGKLLGMLTKDQRLAYKKDGAVVQRTEGAAANWEGWKKGGLVFRDSNFGSVVHKLEKVFQVQIQFEESTTHLCPVTASFDPGKSLPQILDILCMLNGSTYKMISNDQVLIRGGDCNQNQTPM